MTDINFNVIDWVTQHFQVEDCNSETFFYDEMASQSGYSLPIIYQPFDASKREHWNDRGAMFDYLFATHGAGKKLLDFGPGDGWPSLIVAPFAGEVVGVDGSERRVAVCTENAARMGIKNARFLHAAPGSPLPFSDDTFDGVMAASSIEQTPDPKAALRELYRVLKPGGRLRMHYENLSPYRGGQEQSAELRRAQEGTCWLTLYDRHIEAENAIMIHVRLNLTPEKALEVINGGSQKLSFNDLTRSVLEKLRENILETRRLALTHPSGVTYLHWLKEIGFTEANTTHNGIWFAERLFDQIGVPERPTDMAGVDALLRPLVAIIVNMEAPPRSQHGWDPMITAVK